MLRPTVSRRVLGLALGASLGTGIGFGAYALGATSEADTAQVLRAETTSIQPTRSAQTDAPSEVPAPPKAPAPTKAPAPAEVPVPAAPSLTLDELETIAAGVAKGRVVEVDEDEEPTGLRYDVKVLHSDGSSTDIEIDAATGRVVSKEYDRD
jgi:uncharacterized membrane protein YkoI